MEDNFDFFTFTLVLDSFWLLQTSIVVVLVYATFILLCVFQVLSSSAVTLGLATALSGLALMKTLLEGLSCCFSYMLYFCLVFLYMRPDLNRDKWARRQRQILAIDALNFKHRQDQYNMRMVARELNKVSYLYTKHNMNNIE